MAINITKNNGKITIEIDNGHVIALNKIVTDYNLIGEKEAISFMLSIISDADGKPIGNGKGSFLPSEKLKKQNTQNG